jgi:hypothetical protein
VVQSPSSHVRVRPTGLAPSLDEVAQILAGRRVTRKTAGGCLGGAVALGVYVRWVRPRLFSWDATNDEASRPMAGDELCPRPQLNATRAVTIAAGAWVRRAPGTPTRQCVRWQLAGRLAGQSVRDWPMPGRCGG